MVTIPALSGTVVVTPVISALRTVPAKLCLPAVPPAGTPARPPALLERVPSRRARASRPGPRLFEVVVPLSSTAVVAYPIAGPGAGRLSKVPSRRPSTSRAQ